MLEEQLRDAGRELRAVTDSYVREAPSRDGLADVRHRRAVRRRRRRAVVGVAAAVVVFAASAGVLAVTRSGPGHVVTAEPGGVDDRAAIEATIKAIFETEHTVEEALAFIDEPAGLAGVFEDVQADPRAALTLTIGVRSIDLSGDRATAQVSYYLSGRLAATAPAMSFVKKDGRWLITRESYCEVVSAAARCPAPGETYTATTSTSVPAISGGPTQEEIAHVMLRTRPANDPAQHYLPVDSGMSIGDGTGGILTTVVGRRTNTANGEGQLVFFWHDSTFLGWASDREAFTVAVNPAGEAAWTLTYFRSPQTFTHVSYRWVGGNIVTVGELSPDWLGTKVYLADD
jgi:hypothetical protein